MEENTGSAEEIPSSLVSGEVEDMEYDSESDSVLAGESSAQISPREICTLWGK